MLRHFVDAATLDELSNSVDVDEFVTQFVTPFELEPDANAKFL